MPGFPDKSASPVRRWAIRALAMVMLLTLASPRTLCAQTDEGVSSWRAFLLTIGPGAQVYELFGHNAILLVNTYTGDEIAYNWGVFDFDQENFIGRFILGRMLYRLEAVDARRMLAHYLQEMRGVWLAELQLSPTQKRRLVQWCFDNDTEGRREYRYDYYRDNCSTRVRDAIDHATGGQVAEALKPLPTDPPTTYRWHTDRLTRPLPWLHVALHYVLGREVDRRLNRWEEGFLPMELERHLAGLTVVWEDGSTRPLLGVRTTLVEPVRFVEPVAPPDWRWRGLAIAGAISVILIALSGLGRGLLRVAVLGVGSWAGLCVVAGGVLTFGWLFTDHTVARYNENLLLLSPLSLPLVVASGLVVLGRRPRWAVTSAAVPAGLAGVSLVLQPVLEQPNGLIVLIAIPMHVAGWLVMRRVSSGVSGPKPE